MTTDMKEAVPSEADVVSPCERDGCCSTTEDGNAVCILPQAVESASCGCSSSADSSCGCNTSATIQINAIQAVASQEQPKLTFASRLAECVSFWRRFRASIMFVVACIASPCCTPVIVPVILALLAGTPAALWMTQNLGVVFGGLTLLSAVSFVLAFRWMRTNGNRRANVRPTLIDASARKVRS